eukprot:scaffold1698_cov149-Skeletonema_menzelii.AAC.12
MSASISPPVEEQRRLRLKDRTIIPSAPYLLVSNIFDLGCEIPFVGPTICPKSGWRSILPKEWVEFPRGKLSHSFDSSFHRYADRDVSYADFIRWEKVNAWNSGTVHDNVGLSATLHDYYNYAFNTNSTELGMLTNPMALCVLAALVMIVRLLKKVFLPKFSDLGRRLGRNTHGPNWENENEERIVKFGEYVYRLCYHSAVSIYGIWYFRDKSWWNKSQGGTSNLWDMHPNHPIEPGMAWYYLVQCAYNVDALISLMELSFKVELVNPLAYSSALKFLEKEHVVDENQRKKEVLKMMVKGGCDQTVLWTPLFQIKWSSTVRGDFREMMAHHVVTNYVPIDMSKLANFVKWKTTTIVCFVTMGKLDPALHEAIGWTLVSKGETHDYSEHKNGEKQKSS